MGAPTLPPETTCGWQKQGWGGSKHLGQAQEAAQLENLTSKAICTGGVLSREPYPQL